MKNRKLFVVLIFLLGIFFVVSAVSAQDDVRTLSTKELEKKLEEINQKIGDLNVEQNFLRTEPPEFGYDSVETERSGFSPQPVDSSLLNPRAEQNTVKRLNELRHLKSDIEQELTKRESRKEEEKDIRK